MSTTTGPAQSAALAPILADLGLEPLHLAPLEPREGESRAPTLAPSPGASALLALPREEEPKHAASLLQRLEPALAEDGWFLLQFPGQPSDALLARWRNALWPTLHASALYRAKGGRIRRTALHGDGKLPESGPLEGTLLAFRRSRHVLSPRHTVAKFDQNAGGWNGEPGRPGYAHYRWMRRFVGCFAQLPAGASILDFGSGTGWVGIEAALRYGGRCVRAFDPSPQMVRLAEENARASGITDFAGLPGFGEQPPFPRAGEARFDAVLSSGVLSFVPDLEVWIDGLLSTLAPGGVLVIGDLDPESRGMRERRAARPLLPVREMNARSASEMRERLAARGLVWRETAGYQLSWPVPEAMHFSQRRLFGALDLPLLWLNQALAGLDRSSGHRLAGQFDSWVMRFDAPPAAARGSSAP